jgi:predicted ATPase/class 3 adenylate cyclase
MNPVPEPHAESPERPTCRRCGLANPVGFRFCGGCGAPLGPETGLTSPYSEAERRQVTVMFCDLVESTRFAVTRDPEELLRIIRSFHAACTEFVRRYDGTVYQYLGDGILALYGYPHAHEDDAERAVQCALRIVDEIPALRLPGLAATNERIAVRIGIATGRVVAGDPIGQGLARIEAVVGETPILAARLQTLAEPNTIVISDVTRSIVGERFDYADLGSHDLKGFPGSVRVWRVQGARRAQSRFQAARPVPQTPMIGREEDLQWLLDCWHESNGSCGTAVLLGGEPGIGKSRLVEALCERIAPAPGQILCFQCSAHYVNTALHPVIDHITLAAGIGREDAAAEKLAKLSSWIGDRQHADDIVALLGALLSIPMDEAFAAKAASPDPQRERLLELLLGHVRDRSRERRLLLVFEDVHWVDPTTQRWVTLLLERLTELRVLVILTYRPTYTPPWSRLPSVVQRTLARLASGHATALAEEVAGHRLPAVVIAQIVAKTDGVPLFVEELTKAMLGRGPLDTTAPEFAIPSTLHDSLMARLDQLGPAKLMVQVASVIGREFTSELLQAALPLPSERIQDGLREIEEAGLIYPVTRPPETAYVFKHALLQDEAYESLQYSSRRELHVRIARTLEDQFPQTARNSPELVAHHWTKAGVFDRAVESWLAAGRRASERSEYREAIAHLRTGLDLVPDVSDVPVRREHELALCLALAPAIIISKGGGTEEVAALYARALGLCEGTRESTTHFVAGWGWWRASMDHRNGRARADKLLALARNLAHPALVLQAHHCQWATLYMLGAHSECLAHIEAGLTLYDADRDPAYAGLYSGHDARVCGLGEGGLAQWIVGRPQLAYQSVMAALAWAEKLEHVGSRAHAYDFALVLHRFMRDAPAVAARADDLLAFATEQRLRVFAARGMIFSGWAKAVAGAADEGVREMLEGIAAAKAADTPHDFPLYYEMLAEACGCAARWEQGLGVIADALEIADRRGIVYWNAELHRRRAELLWASGERDAAAASIREALECARSQGARSLEIRAVVSMAKMRTGDQTIADALLHRVLEGPADELDTPDLAEARPLLQQAR